ncbi:hypothetical protein S7711_11627 [Stachybotrys chartarum IBT 7711]|uniref:Uncharacterized protein n=1 Tax=Stachybotrys chartarum (strain CBS 109288 / IBT 7711) TaxID=1280523 RepID=A0A084AF71_STACB|nr:hypothetical protein S7711_11627 [Stachybotrys chartarum IBT 7711]KFA45514.1 hypothetical protein S40293_10334 [Stachybotrys chartarum IBT 40293]
MRLMSLLEVLDPVLAAIIYLWLAI